MWVFVVMEFGDVVVVVVVGVVKRLVLMLL